MRRRQWAGCTRWEGSCSSSPRLTPAATPKPPPLRPIRTAPRPSLPSLAPRPAPSARRRWRAGRARAPVSGRWFAFATIPRAACWAALAAAAAAAGRSRAPFCARQAARDATGRTDQCARSLAPPRRAASSRTRAAGDHGVAAQTAAAGRGPNDARIAAGGPAEHVAAWIITTNHHHYQQCITCSPPRFAPQGALGASAMPPPACQGPTHQERRAAPRRVRAGCVGPQRWRRRAWPSMEAKEEAPVPVRVARRYRLASARCALRNAASASTLARHSAAACRAAPRALAARAPRGAVGAGAIAAKATSNQWR